MVMIRRIVNQRTVTVFSRCLQFSRRQLSTPIDGNILFSDCSDIVIPQTTIHEYIYSKIEPFYKYTALECAVTKRSYTYEQIRIKSRNFSKSLRQKLKLKDGDVVAILLPNIPEYLIAALGTLEAGLVITSLNPIYTPEEIARQLKDSSAKILITQISRYNTAKEAIKLTKQNIPILAIKCQNGESLPDGAISFNELMDTKIDIPDYTYGVYDQLAFLPYSSGTTGLPKGVELTHQNMVANLCQSAHPDFNYLIKSSDEYQEVVPGILPLFHIYGFTVVLVNTLLYGGKIITIEKFSPQLYTSVIQKYGASLLFLAPPLVLFLTHSQDVKPEDLKRTRNVMSGAAPLGALDEEKFIEKFGDHLRIVQGYGMTESSPIITCHPIYVKKSQGSIGKLITNTSVKVIPIDDPKGIPLGPNQSGELLVKGPQIMRGYHNNPTETKKAFLDGWLRTGDVVHYNKDKFFFVSDRIKELIKVKGFQVAPAELEEIIRDFSSIEDAAVIGIPHPTHGEVPRAYVVPKKNEKLVIPELEDYVAKKVASYKRLAGGVKIVDSIPKNPSGKILRRQLKLAYQAEGV